VKKVCRRCVTPGQLSIACLPSRRPPASQHC
jgi:hypothetical protein